MSSQEPPKKQSKQVENKHGTLLSWVKPCISDLEPGVVEGTIRIKEQPQMKARIRDVQSLMTKFNFYFGCTLGEQTDNLSRALQDSSTSPAQGNRLAQGVVKALLKDRSDTSFSLFWARILQCKTTEIQTIEDPKLPRTRKAPVRHEVGEQDTHHLSETLKHHNRRIYFNAIDTVTQCIATRFEQEDFKIYVNIQELLLKSFASEPCDTELAEVVKMDSADLVDLDSFKLKGQLCFYHRQQSQWGLTLQNLRSIIW